MSLLLQATCPVHGRATLHAGRALVNFEDKVAIERLELFRHAELQAKTLCSLQVDLKRMGKQVTVNADVHTSEPERLQLVMILPVKGTTLDKETCAEDLPGGGEMPRAMVRLEDQLVT